MNCNTPAVLPDPYVIPEVRAFSFRVNSSSVDIAAFERTAHKLVAADRRFKKFLGEPGIPLGNQLKTITKQRTLQMAAIAGEELGKSLKAGCLRDAVEAQLGINAFYVEAPEGISGAACHLPDGGYVLLNRLEPACRRNFTLGHELFHVLTWEEIPPDRVDLISPSDERPEGEKMADSFSAGLLSRAKERATELPRLYNSEFVRRLHGVLTHGFVSVRKAASVLECDPKDLGDLVEAYGHEVSF